MSTHFGCFVTISLKWLQVSLVSFVEKGRKKKKRLRLFQRFRIDVIDVDLKNLSILSDCWNGPFWNASCTTRNLLKRCWTWLNLKIVNLRKTNHRIVWLIVFLNSEWFLRLFSWITVNHETGVFHRQNWNIIETMWNEIDAPGDWTEIDKILTFCKKGRKKEKEF